MTSRIVHFQKTILDFLHFIGILSSDRIVMILTDNQNFGSSLYTSQIRINVMSSAK